MLNPIKVLERLKMKPIGELTDELSEKNITIYMLQSLDFIVPGEWENVVGFENMVRVVTGESDTHRVEAIADHAREIYADSKQYRRAVGLYRAIDLTDRIVAGAVIADKVGERFGFLDFLDTLTPKSDTMQAIDFGMKLVVEIVSFGLLNGLPRDGIQPFVDSLRQYSQENMMRMATLVAVDGLLTLGPDFINKTGDLFAKLTPDDLEENKIYQQIGDLIPRATASERLDFMREAFASVQDWMSNLLTARNLTTENVMTRLRQAIDISDDKLDYLGAFLDATTNYFAHTGIQSVARHVILEAAATTPYSSRRNPVVMPERRRLTKKRQRTPITPSPLDGFDNSQIPDSDIASLRQGRLPDIVHRHRLELEAMKERHSTEWKEIRQRHEQERDLAKQQQRTEKRQQKAEKRLKKRGGKKSKGRGKGRGLKRHSMDR